MQSLTLKLQETLEVQAVVTAKHRRSRDISLLSVVEFSATTFWRLRPTRSVSSTPSGDTSNASGRTSEWRVSLPGSKLDITNCVWNMSSSLPSQPIGSVRFEIGHVGEFEFPSAFVVSATFALSLFQLIQCHTCDCRLFSIQYLCIFNCEHCTCF